MFKLIEKLKYEIKLLDVDNETLTGVKIRLERLEECILNNGLVIIKLDKSHRTNPNYPIRQSLKFNLVMDIQDADIVVYKYDWSDVDGELTVLKNRYSNEELDGYMSIINLAKLYK